MEFKYRPDVDGLRAVAVILVLLFHANLGFPGGYVGVDVFFVISGYLITGLILKEQRSGEFRLAKFRMRRIRRIVPAATAMVVATLAAGYFLMLPADYAALGDSAIAQQSMLANVYFWRNTGYFDGSSDLMPLLHTWSLAVEEQFYLGYPFLLAVVFRWGRGVSFAILMLLGAASLAASEFGVEHFRSATFYLLPTRAWELLLGGIICFLPEPTRVKPWLLALASWLSLASIIGVACYYSHATRFPGLTALAPCGAAAVLIYANSGRLSFPATVLATKPFVFVGLISYSLYLWHWPILSFLRYRFGESLSASTGAAGLAVAAAAAILSWRFVETPLRHSQRLASAPKAIFAAVASALVLFAFAASIHSTGWRSRYSEAFLKIVETPYAGREHGAKGSFEKGWTLPIIGDGASGAPRFVLWGDSYSKCLAPLIDEVAAKRGFAGYDAGLGGTPPLVGSWTATERAKNANAFNEFVVESCRQESIEWIILFAAWDIHANGVSRLTDREESDSFAAFQRGFERTLRKAETAGKRVVVILQHPYQHRSVPPSVARQVLSGRRGEMYGVSRATHDAYRSKSRQYFASLGKRIVLLDPSDWCFDEARGLSLIGRDRVSYYSDAGHPSASGTRRFFQELVEALFDEMAEERDTRPHDLANSLATSLTQPAQRSRAAFKAVGLNPHPLQHADE